MERKGVKAMLVLAILSLQFIPSAAWAKRMIGGKITTCAGKAAAGVTVKAFDEDDVTAGDHDYMGKAVTDAQGKYSIGPYDDQRWDTYVWTTSWRPDIFIEVYQVIDGYQVAVGKSKTHDDHRQARDLTIDLKLKGIMGTVKDRDGTDRPGMPVSGALVQAFDEDDLSQDDFMNEVCTNSNGAFVMHYPQKYECHYVYTSASCWDTLLPGSVSWRPDIYIEVHDIVRGRRIKINNKSVTTDDVPHRDNVSVQESVPRLDDIDYTVESPWDNNDVLHVLAYNVYLRPTTIFLNGQSIRVPHIVREILRDRYDVIVFSEAFDDELRAQLRMLLASSYPYHAKVVGKDVNVRQDGGVKILRAYPNNT